MVSLGSQPATEIAGLVREDRIHRRVYTDPAIFEAEMARLFGRLWVFVGHESEVAQPGDYRTTAIGRQPVILSRHTDGQVYVLYNRCMHRGPSCVGRRRATPSTSAVSITAGPIAVTVRSGVFPGGTPTHPTLT